MLISGKISLFLCYTCPQVDLLQIIREGVRVDNFFCHFKGNFKGKHYDSAVTPISIFPNYPCCHQFTDFIDTTVFAWVSQGVIKVHSKIGECSPPHLVLPLTVEPSEPRLCHDERFLNLWIRDLPFKLDHLPDLPRYVPQGISRHHLMIRVDTNTSRFIQTPRNSSVFPGEAIIFFLHLTFRMESKCLFIS